MSGNSSVGTSLAVSGEPIGGAEAKAAARIALAGTPESLHEFITTGQHTARLKDDLATNHTDQINRLLAEGDIIVAKAQQNRWIAAEAAAKAVQATVDAQKAAQQAADSARQAQTAANDARTSADKAANSAAEAQKSAATARSAADRANQDASDAENSAAQAEFSASYARQSAKKANDSAEQARQSALAAGKSRDEANAMAKDAWTAVRTLVEKEIAEALRQAEEERKQQEEAKPKPKRICRPFASRESMIPILACAADPEHSTIEVGQNDPFLTAAVWELSGLNDIKACIKDPGTVDCIVAGLSSLPWGRAKVLLKIDDGVEALKHMRATRRAVECLTSNTAHSFPAGTRVLMAAGTTLPIEEIRVGDQVTATDPATGETGSRTVSRAIRTPDDRNFTDVTLADGSSVTSTDSHPYWVESRKRWVDARDLRVGDELRTPVGGAVLVSQVSDRTGLETAYDLTVDDLHTYYIAAGASGALVHNSDLPRPPCSTKTPKLFDKLVTRGDSGPTQGSAPPAGKKLLTCLRNWNC
ncbi:polymorphic toxin-type HINT domain-containing protein [Streptomyces sp. NPDC004667]|uniref:Hint domain-containing protein n=1 Tax=Streptomyces sp. NPDC004667 TaxID=3154285 RepID=UPI0033BCA545